MSNNVSIGDLPIERVLAWGLKQPGATLLDSGDEGTISLHVSAESFELQADESIGAFVERCSRVDSGCGVHELPLVLFASYDIADAVYGGKLAPAQEPSVFPILHASCPKMSLVKRAGTSDWECVISGSDGCATEELKEEILATRAPLPSLSLSVARPLWSRKDYDAAFYRVKECIQRGDFYQANLTQQFEAQGEVDPVALYLELRRVSPAPFACYYDCGDGRAIVSSSPERFVKAEGKHIETRPIKGTRAVVGNPERDAAVREELLNAEKDRAELTMIVDLMRNDISRFCKPGSVRVPEMFRVESFPQVHHLVSTITGECKPGIGIAELLKALMPGGSITGAPKLRSMQELRKLEPWGRGSYTGSIFAIGQDGSIDSNILIRTITREPGRVRFGVGGGIVYDSDCDAEYGECFAKAKGMLQALRAFEKNNG